MINFLDVKVYSSNNLMIYHPKNLKSSVLKNAKLDSTEVFSRLR